jgi:hypothetical protein
MFGFCGTSPKYYIFQDENFIKTFFVMNKIIYDQTYAVYGFEHRGDLYPVYLINNAGLVLLAAEFDKKFYQKIHTGFFSYQMEPHNDYQLVSFRRL